ncbi:MAG: hypothetical protein Q7S16_03545 [bacterium]|nr:hypothetical protein [bacterium]
MKKPIPLDVARRGDPAEVRAWMGLTDGKNIPENELPKPLKALPQSKEVRSHKQRKEGSTVNEELLEVIWKGPYALKSCSVRGDSDSAQRADEDVILTFRHRSWLETRFQVAR